jgi:tetratricopeptide (TPR) repeat protein
MSEALGDKIGILLSLGNIGDVYYRQSNYAQALEYYQKSLTLSEPLGNKFGTALMLSSIGDAHSQPRNHTPAL